MQVTWGSRPHVQDLAMSLKRSILVCITASVGQLKPIPVEIEQQHVVWE